MRIRATALILLVTLLAGCAARQTSVMSWEAYSRLSPRWPYIVTIDAASGALYYFGAAHTWDPSDPQLAAIENAWNEFRPDIAFTEGGSPPFLKTRDEAIRKHGEPGFVRFLAARDNIPTTTLDPSRAEEIAALSSRFSKEQIKLFMILKSVSQFVQREGVSGVDAETERLLAIYSATPGLGGAPRSVAEVEQMYQQSFPDRGRYHDVAGSWFDPVMRETVFNEISRASSDYRDRYVVERLAAHVRDGRRVFAVMGGSHVVMQENALRSRLRR